MTDLFTYAVRCGRLYGAMKLAGHALDLRQIDRAKKIVERAIACDDEESAVMYALAESKARKESQP